MEQWEIDLRAKLEKELPEGAYQLDDGSGGMVVWTGKQGKINFEVELRRCARSFKGLEALLDNDNTNTYCKVTEKDFREFMDLLEKRYDNNRKDDFQA